MNNFDFQQPGGFPLDQDVLDVMQGKSDLAAKSALLGGTQYVLSGCAVVGSNVAPGIIVLNGEILPFDGGAVQAKVIVMETVSNLNYEDGVARPVQKIRKAVFGNDGVTNWLWADFIKPANPVLQRLDKIEKMLKPLLGYTAGGVTVYGSWLFWGRPASEIPAGWEAVPDADWKGRVPVVLDTTQAEFTTVGQTGGEKVHTLTPNEIPELAGQIKFENQGSDGTPNAKTIYNGDGEGNGNGNKTDVLRINIGGGESHNNLQPYKVVLFIRFIG